MQVMPSTAAEFGISRQQLFDPDINIETGLLYLKSLLMQFHDIDLALAGYNAGPKRVRAAGNRVPRIRETQEYLQRIHNYLREASYAEDFTVIRF